MSNRYQNKICLVLGSSRGIGYSIAELMSEEGGTVIITSPEENELSNAVNNLKKKNSNSYSYICDFSDKNSRENVFKFVKEKFGRIDVLVFIVGVAPISKSFFETTESQVKILQKINVICNFVAVKEALEIKLLNSGSNILFIGSSAAYEPEILFLYYGITKLGLSALVKVMAKELNEKNIRVNCLAPCLTKTEFTKNFWKNEKTLEKIFQNFQITKMAEPKQIATVAGYMCSDEAEYMTGETVVVGGDKWVSRL